MDEQKNETKVPALPEGKTTHEELEALGWTFPEVKPGGKGQVGHFKVNGQVVASYRLSNQRFVELI